MTVHGMPSVPDLPEKIPLAAAAGRDQPPRGRSAYRTGGQFAWVSGGRIAAALIQALIMLLLLRAVSPAEFGFFAAALGVVTLAQTTLDLGLPTLVIRERSKDPGQGIVTAALRLNNKLSAALALSILTVMAAVALWIDDRFLLLLPLALWAAAERNADAWLGVILADGDARVNTLNLISRRMGNLTTFVLLNVFTPIDPILAFGLSSALASSASWVFAHAYVAKRLPPPAEVKSRALLAESWPYWVNSVATQARNLDTAIAGIVAGPAQAGFYAAASRLTSPLRILPTSLASVLLPASSSRTSSTMGGVLKLIGVSLAGLTVFYGVLSYVIPWAVPVFLGEPYAGGVAALQITTLGLIFASAASLLGAPLQAVGLKKFVAGIAVLTTATCLVGIALGGYFFGASGAAVGLAASYIVQSTALLSRLAIFIVRKEPNR
jgi:O-antigen/teichoic acid export membrane protein